MAKNNRGGQDKPKYIKIVVVKVRVYEFVFHGLLSLSKTSKNL